MFQKFKNVLFSGIIFTLMFLNAVYSVDYFTEKPSYIPTCKIYEPGFTKCSTNSVQMAMSAIFNGVPEITAVVGVLEPFHLDKIVFQQGNNEVATLKANLTDLVVTGMSKLEVKESRVSKKDFSWQTKVFVPRLLMKGNYKMSGRILIIPLNGAGKMFIDIDKLNLIMHTKTRLYEKGNFTFYNVTQVKVDLSIGGLKTNFDNIFNGNSKEIERSTNEFFNENWRDFFEALEPVIKQTLEDILFKILNPTFNMIPANYMVEDIPTSKQLYGTKT